MPGIKDVAEKAGVSVTTVSRVLNNRGYISNETRNRVHIAMTELNYYPSDVARNLLKQRTSLIGFIIPDISHPFFSMLAKYIEIELYSRGYKLMLCNTIDKSNRETEYLKMLQRSKVDGIIIGSHTLDLDEYKKVRSPLVAIDRDLGELIPIISSDHQKGGILAARQLLRSGCTNVAQIKGYSGVNTPANERYKAFSDEMSRNGISCKTYELEWNQFSFEQYEHAIKNLFNAHKNIDGIFASDMVAVAIIKEANMRKIKIPEQLKIVGFDGLDFTRMITPSITTIKQPIIQIARHSVEMIMNLIDGKQVEQHHIKLDVELIEGSTT